MRFRILLVEDDPNDARLLQLMLATATGSEFIVDTAEMLSQGIASLRRDSFDLVLLALDLPDSRGIQTLRTVLQECPATPILVLTEGDDDELGAQSVREGAQDHLTKGNLPIGTLSRAVRHAIERDRIRKKLKDSEELFKLISENACDLIFVTEPNGTRIYNSPSYKRLLGYDPEQLKGTNPYDQIHPDDHANVRERLTRVDSEDVGSPLVYRMRHNDDGSWRFLESTRSLVRDEHGEVSKIVFINRDVTDRIALEAQFMQSQKMEAAGRLSAGIAHDFNNLLGVVIGYSEILEEKLETGSPLRANVDEILKSAKRAALLTRQLLAFSRQQVFDLKALALNSIVIDVEKLLRRIIGEDIVFETRLDSQLGTIRADQSQIEQVLVNLAVNSRDAMPHGGTLSIETRNEEIEASLGDRFYTQPAGSYVCLIFQDTGVGMDEATKARAFEPFFTTKPKDQGTGLGLSTVYGVVKQSGGYIQAQSALGQGTSIKIYLPRTNDVATTKPAAVKRHPPRRGAETLLIAEDEFSLRSLGRNILRSTGYRILEAQNGHEALEISRRHTGDIAALLTDVVMPGMGGKALAEILAVERPDMKIIYMSGYPGHTYKEQWPLEPGRYFINKPFTRDDLCQKVAEALESRPPRELEKRTPA